MGLFRIFSSKDVWITNEIFAGKAEDVRATGSNHGQSPSMRVFAEKETFSGSIELGRALLQFDTTELSGKIFDDQTIPTAGVQYILRMFDLRHDQTVPTSYDLFAFPVSQSWDEGTGIDDDTHKDFGFANWLSASSTQTWTVTGSDFTASFGSGSMHFDLGTEDLEMNVTEVVENWLSSSVGNGGLPNNGLVVKLGETEESNATDYFVKMFHSRESLFVDKIPYLEARWSDVDKDHRGNFAFDVENNIYFYNFIRGELTQVTEPVTVRLQDHIVGVSASYSQEFTVNQPSDGILTSSMTVENTASFSGTWHDIWFSGSRVYVTGTFFPLVLTGSQVDQYDEFDINVTNLKRRYKEAEETRFIVSVRKRDFITHRGIVGSASLDIEREYIEKMYYSIQNEETGESVIPFGTGSIPYTQLSYNEDGNYFNFSMNSLLPGFAYRILFLIDINQNDMKIVDENLLFRVE